jgi:hypothetical protein
MRLSDKTKDLINFIIKRSPKRITQDQLIYNALMDSFALSRITNTINDTIDEYKEVLR